MMLLVLSQVPPETIKGFRRSGPCVPISAVHDVLRFLPVCDVMRK
jgi:hypothetical protein